jgi:hypothetical protein
LQWEQAAVIAHMLNVYIFHSMNGSNNLGTEMDYCKKLLHLFKNMNLTILSVQINVVYFIIIAFKEQVCQAGKMSKERSTVKVSLWPNTQKCIKLQIQNNGMHHNKFLKPGHRLQNYRK